MIKWPLYYGNGNVIRLKVKMVVMVTGGYQK